MGSLFRTALLVVASAASVRAKSEMPRAKLLNEGKRAKAERLTPPMQSTATARSAFLNDGR